MLVAWFVSLCLCLRVLICFFVGCLLFNWFYCCYFVVVCGFCYLFIVCVLGVIRFAIVASAYCVYVCCYVVIWFKFDFVGDIYLCLHTGLVVRCVYSLVVCGEFGLGYGRLGCRLRCCCLLVIWVCVLL